MSVITVITLINTDLLGYDIVMLTPLALFILQGQYQYNRELFGYIFDINILVSILIRE
jgi:hypothetical protein